MRVKPDAMLNVTFCFVGLKKMKIAAEGVIRTVMHGQGM